MCPSADATPAPGKDEMVPIVNDGPHIPPPIQETNGHSEPPKVKSHNQLYGRASDFLSNTSNWKVSFDFLLHNSARGWFRVQHSSYGPASRRMRIVVKGHGTGLLTSVPDHRVDAERGRAIRQCFLHARDQDQDRQDVSTFTPGDPYNVD
jgi:hypothetical protein